MKYEIGDEVLVKCKVIGDLKNGRYKVTNSSNSMIGCETVRSLFPLFEEVYPVKKEPDMTAEEAWEISKKLFSDYSNSELDEIFGKGWSYTKLMELTPQQAKAKIKAWEAKNEIKVGDVVAIFDEDGVVTRVDAETGFFNVLKESGCTGSYKKIEIKKTGRHVDIEGILKQIGGNK